MTEVLIAGLALEHISSPGRSDCAKLPKEKGTGRNNPKHLKCILRPLRSTIFWHFMEKLTPLARL